MKHKSLGISLIEVMIAMTLGLMLLVGVVQLFLSSKQSYSVVLGQSQTLDSGRLAMHFLGQAMRKSGYWSRDWDRSFGADAGISAGSYTGVFEREQYVYGLNDDATDAAVVDGSDQVYVRFTGDNLHPMSNCLGTAIAEDQVVIERYYLRVAGTGEQASSLVCETTVLDINVQESIDRGEVTVPAGATTITQPLVAGVENMQILFGERNASGTEMSFQRANSVTDWSLVESVKIALLAVSPEGSQSGLQRSSGYKLFDVTSAVPTDTRIRSLFEHTIAVRNPNANPAI